jgi:hypothetical protein
VKELLNEMDVLEYYTFAASFYSFAVFEEEMNPLNRTQTALMAPGICQGMVKA